MNKSEELMTSNVGNKMATGAAWMILVRLLDRSIGLVSTLILARLLVPADFGLVAMATAIGALLDILGGFSFEMALIQNPTANRSHYDTVWTFNVLFGAFCAIAFIVIAAPAARFYNDAKLENVMYVLAIGYFLNGISNIGTVDFRKELKFREEFIMQFSRRIVMFVVTVVGAYLYRSYWALVIGILVGRISGVLLSYYMHYFRPRLSMAGWWDLFHFSKWLFLNNMAYFLNQKSGDFIIGRMIGFHGLGLYNMSYELSNMPTSEIAAPINRAVFPGYAKIAQDKNELRRLYLNVLGGLAIIAIPVGVGIALISKYIVPVLLGEKWIEAIPIIQVLAVFGALNVIQNNCGIVYIVQGDSRLTSIFTMAFSVILILFIVLLIENHGIMGVAWAYLFASIIIVPINLYVAAKQLGLNLKDHWNVLNRPVISSIGMTLLFVFLINSIVGNMDVTHKVIPMFLLAFVGCIIYVTVYLILWIIQGKPDGIEQFFLRKFLRQ